MSRRSAKAQSLLLAGGKGLLMTFVAQALR